MAALPATAPVISQVAVLHAYRAGRDKAGHLSCAPRTKQHVQGTGTAAGRAEHCISCLQVLRLTGYTPITKPSLSSSATQTILQQLNGVGGKRCASRNGLQTCMLQTQLQSNWSCLIVGAARPVYHVLVSLPPSSSKRPNAGAEILPQVAELQFGTKV